VDQRRWCYDVLKPTSTDDRGNRNNTITVGGAQGKKAQHPQKQHEAKHGGVAEEAKHGGAAEEAKYGGAAEEAKYGGAAEEAKHEHEHGEEEAKPQGKGKGQQQQGKGKGQQQQQGKGKGQQQQGKGKEQQQKKEQAPKKEKAPKEEEGEKEEAREAARAQSINLIKTVTSYNVPFYVGDVNCGDSLEDVLEIARLFHEALPEVGVMLVSGGLTSFIVAAVVPTAKAATMKATELVDTALSVVAGAKGEGTDTFAHGVVAADPEKGIFPIKLKDLCRGPAFIMLRKRGLVKDDESDDEMCFLEDE